MAALIYCKRCNGLLATQIEKHNVNVYAGFAAIMIPDVWDRTFLSDPGIQNSVVIM